MTFINVNIGSLTRQQLANLTDKMNNCLMEKDPEGKYLIVPCLNDGSARITISGGDSEVILIEGDQIYKLTCDEIYNIIKERRNKS